MDREAEKRLEAQAERVLTKALDFVEALLDGRAVIVTTPGPGETSRTTLKRLDT